MEHYTFNPRDYSHQGVRVGIHSGVTGNHVYVSTDWHPGEYPYMTGTFMSADDAENLAIVLMYYAQLARGEA